MEDKRQFVANLSAQDLRDLHVAITEYLRYTAQAWGKSGFADTVQEMISEAHPNSLIARLAKLSPEFSHALNSAYSSKITKK